MQDTTANCIKLGDIKEFRSSLSGRDGNGLLVRQFTGENVTVVDFVDQFCQDRPEKMFRVETESGIVFSAWQSELDGTLKEPYEKIPFENVQLILKK